MTIESTQRVSVITLGTMDMARSRRFYAEGFGWQPVFENPEVVFYQMNGLMLGTWLTKSLEADMRRALTRPGAFSLAHNVATRDEVQPVIDRLAQYGGKVLRPADAPRDDQPGTDQPGTDQPGRSCRPAG